MVARSSWTPPQTQSSGNKKSRWCWEESERLPSWSVTATSTLSSPDSNTSAAAAAAATCCQVSPSLLLSCALLFLSPSPPFPLYPLLYLLVDLPACFKVSVYFCLGLFITQPVSPSFIPNSYPSYHWTVSARGLAAPLPGQPGCRLAGGARA